LSSEIRRLGARKGKSEMEDEGYVSVRQGLQEQLNPNHIQEASVSKIYVEKYGFHPICRTSLSSYVRQKLLCYSYTLGLLNMYLGQRATKAMSRRVGQRFGEEHQLWGGLSSRG
jgi:hypothetical protein